MNKTVIALLVAVLIACAATVMHVNAQRVPITIHHLAAVKRVGAPVVSPKGDVAVYTVRFWNEQKNMATTNLERLNIADNTITKLTNPAEGGSDSGAIFSNDGAFVFFTRKGQIFYVPTSGSEAQVKQLATLPVDASNLKFSPNGKFLLFTTDVYVDCDTLQCTADRDAAIAKRGPNTGVVYDQMFVRHWDTWIVPGKASHIIMVPLSKTDSTTFFAGTPIDLLLNFNANAPVPPFGGAEQFDISPDGTEFAFTAELIARNMSWTTGWKIYIAPITAPGARTCITGYTSARTQQPLYSPDGNSIAFLAMDRPGLESDRLHIQLYDRKSGGMRSITGNIDISFGSMIWYSNSQGFIADADSDGSHKLYSIPISGVAATEITNSGHNANQVLVPGTNTVLFTRDTFAYPADVWKFDFTDATPKSFVQITNYNKDLLDKLQLSTYEKFYFTGADGDNVQGFLMKPYGWKANATYPLANLVHGGPESGWADSWSFRWNPQLWAARGYAVVIINFHGSTGFGQKFTDSIRGNWGSKPYFDVMKGVDTALSNNPWIDGNRACSCGASYGGYFMAWTNSQTDRFKCLVMHDGVFDQMSMAYATEELWFTEAENGGTPYDNPEGYEKYNPRRFAKNMKTPTLVIHGGMDFRIPVSEGLGMFTALQRRGIPSKFLYFPMENHWVLNPNNSIMWYDNVLGWLDTYTSNKPPQ